MKIFYLLLLLSLPALTQAQYDFTGTWEGVLTQNTGGYAPEYEFTLYLQQEGNQITGRSYVKYGNIFAEMKLTGQLVGDKAIHWEESAIIDNWKHENMEWCYKQATLFIVAQGKEDKLEGPWSGNTGQSDCIPGKIMLKRTSPRA
ncbi:MAG: hypothetical protein RIC19_06360 [Phaeodactylibacter sp.]|uniref:hypothetical protein n=1 Tax=Phaeodactylibacter sp. TaxID=1940289 RepID=UPI0032EF2F7C